MELQYRKNDKTGEELYYTTHSSGLGIYIIPKKEQNVCNIRYKIRLCRFKVRRTG